MKRITVSALLVLTIVLSACDKEPTRDIKPLILGTWRLEKIIDEEYHPISVLVTRDEDIGMPGDSVTFRPDNIMVTYSDDGSGPWEDEYTIIDENTIEAEGERYKIIRLTETEFHLQEEETDMATNEKWVYKILMKR